MSSTHDSITLEICRGSRPLTTSVGSGDDGRDWLDVAVAAAAALVGGIGIVFDARDVEASIVEVAAAVVVVEEPPLVESMLFDERPSNKLVCGVGGSGGAFKATGFEPDAVMAMAGGFTLWE